MATTQSYQFAIVQKISHVTTVILNRPERLNALHRDAHEELGAIFDDFAADDHQWVAIITGAGDRAFCAGYDLKAIAAGEEVSFPSSGFGGLTRRFDCNKPLIAAVNGLAFGGGFELALACDIVVAAQGSSFALPEPLHGLMAASGLPRLPLHVGLKTAMGIILTGRRVPSDEALALGLVNEVVADSDVLEAANRWAQQICRCSPLALRASKEAVSKANASLASAILTQNNLPSVRELHGSSDFLEGPVAFEQKRLPNWTGR